MNVNTGASSIAFCPLHAAAPDLLAALEAQSLSKDYGGGLCFCGDEARNPPLTPPHIPACEQARAALTKARAPEPSSATAPRKETR